jgi:uncharacterized membrane protein YoaT (DUF817 family)
VVYFGVIVLIKTLHLKISGLLIPSDADSTFAVFGRQLFLFGYLQALSCVFPVLIFIFLACSSVVNLPLPRYDLLLLVFIAAQIVLYKTGMETKHEVLVITLFHMLGIFLEWFKVWQGSWTYPEDAVTKVMGVPLYAGFMYASVGSYICQAWKNLNLSTRYWPPAYLARLAGALIYLNFFANAFVPDMRWYIAGLLVVIFRRSYFIFMLNRRQYSIHALLSFLLIGCFIWLAENIATYFGAWKYAYQHAGWQMVSWHKITSWSLLVIVSIIIVTELKHWKDNILAGKRFRSLFRRA